MTKNLLDLFALLILPALVLLGLPIALWKFISTFQTHAPLNFVLSYIVAIVCFWVLVYWIANLYQIFPDV